MINVKRNLIFLILILSFGCVQKETTKQTEHIAQSRTIAGRATLADPFQVCSDSKMYLESQILKMPATYRQSHEDEDMQRLPMKCIQFAQRNYYGKYASCETEDSKPRKILIKPCLTENYVQLAYNAYHDVMDCFNLNPKDHFLQIMIESGFHINAINSTDYDSGMGQFTANGIKNVLANSLVDKAQRILLESSRPSCQRISSIVGKFSIDAFTVEKRCSMIALPKNPYRSMLFSYLHTMRDQTVLDRMLTDFPDLEDALTKKVRRQMLLLAYNRGMLGVKRLLQGYIDSRKYFNQTVTESDLELNKNLGAIKKILKLEPAKRNLLKKAKVKNLSFAEYAIINGATYLSDMSAAEDYVQRQYGDICGEL